MTSLLRLSRTLMWASDLLSASFRTAFQAASVVPYSGPGNNPIEMFVYNQKLECQNIYNSNEFITSRLISVARGFCQRETVLSLEDEECVGQAELHWPDAKTSSLDEDSKNTFLVAFNHEITPSHIGNSSWQRHKTKNCIWRIKKHKGLCCHLRARQLLHQSTDSVISARPFSC